MQLRNKMAHLTHQNLKKMLIDTYARSLIKMTLFANILLNLIHLTVIFTISMQERCYVFSVAYELHKNILQKHRKQYEFSERNFVNKNIKKTSKI